MNAIKEEITLYKCSKCGKYYTTEDSANNCCPKKYCDDCGKLLGDKYYYTVCDTCRDKRNYDNFTKMTYEEYMSKYPKNMIAYNDKYANTIEDLLDDLSCDWENVEDIPTYVYGTKRYTHDINIEWAIENALEDAYEDAEFNNTEELIGFVNEWNKKNHIHSYSETNIIIWIPEDIRQKYMKGFNNVK